MLLMLRQYYETGEIHPEEFVYIEVEFDDPLIFPPEGDEYESRADWLKKSKEELITEIRSLGKKVDYYEVEAKKIENEQEEKMRVQR